MGNPTNIFESIDEMVDVHLELWPKDLRAAFERNERKKLCGTHNG
jgi:hypothetical protein